MDPKAIENHIRQRFDDRSFDVNRLADELKVSESYLREIVNLSYNCSPHHLIETIRLEKAIRLLQNKNIHVYSVCSNVGYANLKTFRTAFKKRIGIAPCEFKNILYESKNMSVEIEYKIHCLWSSYDI
ncbi:MAG: helix-turn-helix transcriptional regulator [bacterium]